VLDPSIFRGQCNFLISNPVLIILGASNASRGGGVKVLFGKTTKPSPWIWPARNA